MNANTANNKDDKYVLAVSDDINKNGKLDADDEAIALTLEGWTLYITAASNNHYVLLDEDCQFYVRGTNENGRRDSDYELYTDVDSALDVLGNVSMFTGSFVAICDPDTGYATTIIINDAKYEHEAETPVETEGNITLSGVTIGGTRVAAVEGYADIDDAVDNARTVYLSSSQLNSALSFTVTTSTTANAVGAVYDVFNDVNSVDDVNNIGAASGHHTDAKSHNVSASNQQLGNNQVIVIAAWDNEGGVVSNITYFAYVISERAE